MHSNRRPLSRFLGGLMALWMALLAPLQAGAAELIAPAMEASPEAESVGEAAKMNPLRVLAGFAVTSGLKFALGGVGPAQLLPLLSGLGPAAGVASLVGLSLVEAGISISLFQMIAGFKTDDRQFLAFLLAASSTALITPLILGPLGVVATTLVTNAARLVLFNLIARKEGEKIRFGLDSFSGPRPAETETMVGADGIAVPEISRTAKMDLLDGDLASLHAEVQARYRQMVDEPGDLSPEALDQYARAKASLDKAVGAALR